MKFKLPYDLIVLDLECSQPNDLIIELGAVKLLRDGTMGQSFSSLVKVDGFLGFCKGEDKTITELTGITEEMVSYAPSFEKVLQDFKEWAFKDSKNVILSSWGNYDLACMVENCKYYGLDFPFRKKGMDIKSIVVFLTNMFCKKYKTDSLSSLLKAHNITWDSNIGTPHRALSDAYHTALLLQKIWKEYENTSSDITKSLGQIGIK